MITLHRDTETRRHIATIDGRRVGWVRYTIHRSWPCVLTSRRRVRVIATPTGHPPKSVKPGQVRDPAWWAQFTQEIEP